MCSINMFTFRLPKILWTFMQTFMQDYKQCEAVRMMSFPVSASWYCCSSSKKKRRKKKHDQVLSVHLLHHLLCCQAAFPFFLLSAVLRPRFHRRGRTQKVINRHRNKAGKVLIIHQSNLRSVTTSRAWLTSEGGGGWIPAALWSGKWLAVSSIHHTWKWDSVIIKNLAGKWRWLDSAIKTCPLKPRPCIRRWLMTWSGCTSKYFA